MNHSVSLTLPETPNQVQGLIGGWHDSALTPRRLEQAGRITGQLREVTPTKAPPELYTSDLQRCLQTTEVIAVTLQPPMQVVPDLREVSYGEAEHRPDLAPMQKGGPGGPPFS